MKIYKLFNLANGYATIDFTNIDMNAIANGNQNVTVLSEQKLKWHFLEDDVVGDCPFYIGAFPIFESSKIENVSFDASQKATFYVEGGKYTAIAAPIITGNIINEEKSEMRKFKSGKIMSVKKFVLKRDTNYPPIFRIKDYPLYTFVNEEILAALKDCGLSQLKYEECDLQD